MTENLQETRPIQATPLGTNGNGHHPEGIALENPPKRRSMRRLIVLPVLLIVLVVAGFVGYQYLLDQQLYVSTDNAQISGSLIQVGAVNAGRVEGVTVDIGDRVQRDQVVGTVLLPSTVGMSQSGTPLLGFVGTENQRVEIKAPASGIVVARSANPGDTIAAGQPVVTITDPSKFYVQAQIEETKLGRVKVGQDVTIKVDSLGKSFPGKVTAVNRASSATFSLLPSSNSSGNFTKVTQLVPVRISVDAGDQPLVLGSSVEVHIRVEN